MLNDVQRRRLVAVQYGNSHDGRLPVDEQIAIEGAIEMTMEWITESAENYKKFAAMNGKEAADWLAGRE